MDFIYVSYTELWVSELKTTNLLNNMWITVHQRIGYWKWNVLFTICFEHICYVYIFKKPAWTIPVMLQIQNKSTFVWVAQKVVLLPFVVFIYYNKIYIKDMFNDFPYKVNFCFPAIVRSQGCWIREV